MKASDQSDGGFAKLTMIAVVVVLAFVFVWHLVPLPQGMPVLPATPATQPTTQAATQPYIPSPRQSAANSSR